MIFSLAASNAAQHGSNTDIDHEIEECRQALFDASPLPMWIQDAENLRLLAASGAALLRRGCTRDAFFALSPSELQPGMPAATAHELAVVLESFFHDLRASLRGIDGLSRGIWAEGRADDGASFYLSLLPAKNAS